MSALTTFHNHLKDTFSSINCATLGKAALTLAFGYYGFKLTRRFLHRRKLNAIVKQKQEEWATEFRTFRQTFMDALSKNPEKQYVWKRIVALPIDHLQNQLKSEQVFPTEVLRAFQWQSIDAHLKTNCLVGLIREADAWAAELEQQYRGKDDKPPLYGIPISLKGCVKVKGYKATRGYAQDLLSETASVDAPLVAVLKKLGAIPFVFTNVPQSMLSFGSSNPVFGVTTNPFNKDRTSGGSSSGEAALVALNGSAIGVGSDVAGSIRLPAHYCGICGIRPTQQRCSATGFFSSNPGRAYVGLGTGPLARSVEHLAVFLKAIYCDELFKADAYMLPLPFRSQVYESQTPLTIGWYEFDGWFTATTSCIAAVHTAKQALEAKGHKLVKFAPPSVPRAVELFVTALNIDGGKYIADILQGDIVDKHHKFLDCFFGSSLWLKWLYATLLQPFYPKKALVWRSHTYSTLKLKEIFAAIDGYRREFAEKLRELQLDAILCPASASPSVAPKDAPPLLFWAYSYTFLYNLLDYPGGVVPISTVTQNDIVYAMANYVAKEPAEKRVKQSIVGSLGLPVGVQVVAPPYNEEVILRLMKEIESVVKRK